MQVDKKKYFLIGGLCLLIVLVILAICLLAGNGGNTGETQPQQQTGDVQDPANQPTTGTTGTGNSTEETVKKPLTEVPNSAPSVQVPDADSQKEGLQFPSQVPGHNLIIEKLEPYAGMFVEDGTNAQVQNVAMLLVNNVGQEAIEYAEITVRYADQTLVFHITALPAGGRMVVQEATGKAAPASVPQEATALVVKRTQMAIAQELSVVDNGELSVVA